MMRSILVVLAVAGCTGGAHSRFPFEPLPELVVAKPPSAPLAIPRLFVEPGEHAIWDISAKGFAIARAELAVDASGNETSKLETSLLASSVTSIKHELSTVIDPDGPRPKTAVETLAVDGETTHVEAAFDAAAYVVDGRAVRAPNVHTLHTALAALRAWVAPEAHGGFLQVLVAGDLYRLEVDQPGLEDLSGAKMFRIHCRILPPPPKPGDKDRAPISASIWFSADDARVPMRIEIAGTSGKLVAELIERTHA